MSDCAHDMVNEDAISVHLLAGGLGGTAGAFVTCPLEVLKTRLQSSVYKFGGSTVAIRPPKLDLTILRNFSSTLAVPSRSSSPGLLFCFRHIVQTEGASALFKGLGPNLIGVAPARAIFFSVYSKAKASLSEEKVLGRDSRLVPIFSGAAAGFAAVNATCPIWVLKTRLQLDNRRSHISLRSCIQRLYETEGIRGFYRGLCVSYIGIFETMIYFSLYEDFKVRLNIGNGKPCNGVTDLLSYMVSAAAARSIACTVMYPHEVVRTRVRQPAIDGFKKYQAIVPTLRTIIVEEGVRALYGGLSTQLIRQIPNTATMFVVYETVVNLLTNSD